MAVKTKHLMSLVELSQRRAEPASANLQRRLHLARLFEADPSTTIAFRSLAWLGVGVSAPRRAYLALKRLLGNRRAACAKTAESHGGAGR